MSEFPGYHLTEQLFRSPKTLCMRGIRELDKRPVLLKTLTNPYPSVIDRANYKNEYEITRDLGLPQVLKPIALEMERNKFGLAMEDFPGDPTHNGDFFKQFGIAGFLEIALQVAEFLGECHQRKVIHRNLKPHNILIDKDKLDVKVIGFLLTSLRDDRFSEDRFHQLAVNLRYISPEQTGRLNRKVDYRTDFYSLGVTFYEWLTGKTPFSADDPMALVHSHLAVEPETPRTVNPDIPEVIAQIVMKLLKKTPEDRYQSGFGLAHDLKRCLNSLKEKEVIENFPIAELDVSHELHVPRKLYGRDLEINTMLSELAQTAAGKRRFIAIHGASGMGKSELVYELQEPIAKLRGNLIVGRCEQSKKTPFKALVQAFEDLIHKVLAQSPRQVAAFKSALTEALGDNGQVMLEVLPELEMIIGAQPELPVLGSAETQNRFKMTIRQFLSVFAREEHPLVIFIDDLQWAGERSKELYKDILTDTQLGHIFFITACRSGDAEPDKPLGQWLASLNQLGVSPPPLELKPLNVVDVQGMLSDVLGYSPESCKSLAEVITKRSEGRPFHIALFLKTISDSGLLFFDARNACWNWDLEAIRSRQVDDEDISELVAERFRRMPDSAQSILKIAACIGDSFDLALLATACQKPQVEVADALQEAVSEELIEPLGDAWRLLQVYEPGEIEAAEGNIEILFRFPHSRIHHVIYAMMDEDQSKATHLSVGQRLLKNNEDLTGDLFSVVNQLNQGRQIMDNNKDRLQLSRLNLKAGLKAMDSIAYQHAVEYLRIAVELLPDHSRDEDYDFWFNLQLHLAEAEFFNNHIENAESILEMLLDRARSNKDKARVHYEKVLIFNNISRLNDAVREGIQGLRLFGLSIPEDKDQMIARFNEELAEVRAWFKDHEYEEILSIPPATDEAARECMQLLMILTPPAFNSNQDLFRLIAVHQVQNSLKNGNTSDSPWAFAVLGIILCTLGDYQSGYKLGRLARRLTEKFPDPVIRYKVDFIGCNMLNHWGWSLSEDLPVLQDIYRASLIHGDMVYANYTVLVDYQHRWVLDQPLLKILDEGEQQILFAERTKNAAVMESQRYINRAVLNLRGLTRASDSLETEDFNEEECEKNLIEASYWTGVSVFRIIRTQVLYLRGHYRKAYAMGLRAEETIRFSDNTLMMPVHYFFFMLSMAAVYDQMDEDDRMGFLERLEASANRFKKWADHCPENFLHRYHMLAGEIARLKKDDGAAIHHFQDAIHAAKEHGYMMHEALAHELAARFFLSRGMAAYLEYHLRSAIIGYTRWGATAKVADLEDELGDYLQHAAWGDNFESGSESDRRAAYSQALDMSTLMKSAQTISGEFRIDRLLKKLMALVLENAGAQKGYLILNREGMLVAEARGEAANAAVELLDRQALEKITDLPKSMVHYAARTKSDILIEDVKKDKQFRGDDYLNQSGVKAVLCMPMMRQTELVGLLYLENHLAAGAFSQERVEMLRLLAPQIAISLENARYVSEMTELNKTLKAEVIERTKAESALKKAQRIALSNAQKAAKAEFASTVLHNINNVLNSVWLASEIVVNANKKSRIGQLTRLVALMEIHKDNYGAFFGDDPKGKVIPSYLGQLARVLDKEHNHVKDELGDLTKNLSLMRDMIEKQQADAKGFMKSKAVDLILLMEDSIKVQQDSINRYGVRVERNYEAEEPVHGDDAQVTHIFINLIKNAVEAMGFSENKTLQIRSFIDEEHRVCVSISDSGVGITPKDLESMFTHGFTTKKDGHGFGLHFCAKAMKEMDGSIDVHSEGRGKGATFTLRFQPETA